MPRVRVLGLGLGLTCVLTDQVYWELACEGLGLLATGGALARARARARLRLRVRVRVSPDARWLGLGLWGG